MGDELLLSDPKAVDLLLELVKFLCVRELSKDAIYLLLVRTEFCNELCELTVILEELVIVSTSCKVRILKDGTIDIAHMEKIWGSFCIK